MLTFGRQGGWQDFNTGDGRPVRPEAPPWIPGFQIHLKLPFCSDGRIFGAKGVPMWNGWKKAAIGLSALLAFVLLELMAVIGGVAVFLGLVMDVDLPFFAVSEE
ncbi:hypothetical protein V1286_003061 [Bradyrhizobium algeriense]|uniref:Uncharacterized protein n=2 Tax=Bradyrhizobium TaxID=374 RepID=A0ABU8BBP2_9BRAD